MKNLILALETWKDVQLERLPPAIELICPKCGRRFSTGFLLPQNCPNCRMLLLQPRGDDSRALAIIAFGVLAVAIPTALYFFLGALSNDQGTGKVAKLLVENRAVFFFVMLAFILPFAKDAIGGTTWLFGGLFQHAIGKESEQDLLQRFRRQMSYTKGVTDEMEIWMYCRLSLANGPPGWAHPKPFSCAQPGETAVTAVV